MRRRVDRRSVCDHDDFRRRIEIRIGQVRLALAGLLAARVPIFIEIRAAFLHVVEIRLELAVFAERERTDKLFSRAIGERLEPDAAAVREALAVKLVNDVAGEVFLALRHIVRTGVVRHVLVGDLHLIEHLVDLGAVRLQRLLHAGRRELRDVAIAAEGRHARDDCEADQDGRQQNEAHLELDAAESRWIK